MATRNRRNSENSDCSLETSIDSDEFLFRECSHSILLLMGLNNLRTEYAFCDVTLCVDGQEFLCHRVVLASFSPYFKAMFSGELAESKQEKVSINGVEASMIEMLIKYAYTSEIWITKTNVQSLLSAANLLEILPVRDACCRFMEKHMDASNSIGIHCFAEAHSCTELQEKSKVHVLENFTDVIKHEEFVKLSHSKLVEFISNDELNIKQEECVFDAIMAWFNANPENRRQYFEEVFTHIRLPLVSAYFLHDFVEVQSAVRQSEVCRKLVDEAKNYQLLQDRRGQLYSPRTRPRRSTGTIEVIVAVGGEDDKVVLRSVESYDPQKDQWKTLACLPFAVSKHGLVVSGNNFMYMSGGEFPDGSASKDVWRYDPSFDHWLEMAPMNVPRSELGLAIVDGSIFAVGGWEGSARLESVEKYDTWTNIWMFVSPMKIAVTSPAVVAHEGLLYVTGGAVLEDGDGIDLVQCYNPKTDRWKELSAMLIPRSGSAACVLNDHIYIIGGWHASTENTNKVERYDPKKNEWEIKAPMHERRYRPGVAVIDGKIYVLGGEEGWDRHHDTIECYDESKDCWEIVGEMPSSRSWLSCVAMQTRKDLPNKDAKVTSCIV
ncbi:kelch-like protein 24 [Saccoglossus kowalevskii]|uniref:Kelch-like protein diablo-like n=1 Tax=Saccoglossus kowalevskii TaxID=10224 RepID=A0ABM0GJ49_SACKO|nr:PREDICTED: kelch-like protein diablo-like [Saccoglossus kowalevskii]